MNQYLKTLTNIVLKSLEEQVSILLNSKLKFHLNLWLISKYYFYVSGESKANFVIQTCITKETKSQCGIFKFRQDRMRECMLTCQEDKCNSTPQYFVKQNVFTILFCSTIFAFLHI